MGYTHQFTCQPGSRQYAQTWPQIVEDTGRILETVRRHAIAVCGPGGTGVPIVDVATGILFGGDATAGQHHGAFRLPAPGLVEPDAAEDCRLWRYTKTEHAPYDLAVTSVLLRCHVLLPGVFQIGSDSEWGPLWTWPPGRNPRDLHQHLFGIAVDTDPLVDPTLGLAVGPAGWIDPRLLRDPYLKLLFEIVEARGLGGSVEPPQHALAPPPSAGTRR